MSVWKLLNNFSAGEFTPLLSARTDLAKYDSACQSLQNCRVIPWGGGRSRAGTLFVAEAKYADKPVRMIGFNYSTSVAYALEVGDFYMRFYRLVGPTTNAAYWIRTSAYTNGVYVQWQGVTYRCIQSITSTIPPSYNNSPDIDTSHWVSQTKYEVIQVQSSTDDADYWVNVYAYTPGDYVQWQGKVYLNILAVSAVIPPSYNNSPDLDATHWTLQTVYEISTPWGATELADLQFKQLNDVVYFTHPNYEPRKLSRTSSVTFTLGTISWKYPALLDENLDTTKTLALGALTGSTSLTAAGHTPFTASHVGSYWEVKHLRDSVSAQLDISASAGTTYSSSVEVVGDWSMETSQTWYGTLNVQRSEDAGSTWTIVRQIKSISNHNARISGSESPPIAGKPKVQLRMQYIATGDPFGTPPWVGAVPNSYVLASAYLEVSDAYSAGLVKVTGYTSSTVVTVTVINAPSYTTATNIWSEGAWSGVRGYPRAIGLFEQRIIFLGTSYKPNSFWMAVAGDFENFLYSDLDDGAIAYQPATCQQNPTAWCESLDKAYMGTSGEEMAITSGNENEALTPANVTARSQSGFGSANIQPVVVGKCILFVERQATRLREMSEGNPFLEKGGPTPIDLTLLSEHITESGIKEIAFAKQPDQQVFCVRNDGVLAVMTYNKDQNIAAWVPWDTQGSFLSVCSLYGTPADVIVTAVERVLPAGVKKYIEVFTAENSDPVAGINGQDCAIYQEQASSVTVSNLAHLKGLTVAVVADGYAVGNLTVSSGGTVTLPNAIPATKIRVGLPYTSVLQPMPIDLAISNGTSQGRKKKLSEVVLRFHESLGVSYGNASTHSPSSRPQQFKNRIEFREQGALSNQPVDLFTGDKVLQMQAGSGLRADVVITQSQPFAFTLLGIFAKLEVYGE